MLSVQASLSTFRQAAQVHSDWVNDIVLCNQDQMRLYRLSVTMSKPVPEVSRAAVSASSDGTVKAWSPHSTPLSDPVTVGTHADYVRCFAYR